MPFFSVIIPLYNKEGYIKSTLQSVLDQTFSDFEIIVINDGSTDDSAKIVAEFLDDRICYHEQNNKGLSATRNVGIKKAKANYIAFLDADDLWETDYLECIAQLIKKYNTHSVFATDFRPWRKVELPDLNTKYPKISPKIINDYFQLKKNIFCYSSIVFKSSVFEGLGYFDETINYGEEEDFTIRTLQHFQLIHLPIAKVFYRVAVDNQMTSITQNSKRIVPDYTKYFEKNADVKSYVDFVHFKLLVLYKMERNTKKVRYYKNLIAPESLTFSQKLKYYLPTQLFFLIKSGYQFLRV